jgi:hypothetical protein
MDLTGEMSSIDAPLAAILADPLAAVRAGGALGYLGLDIPPDLLLAGSRPACHLPWRTHRKVTRASAWLEGSFPPWAAGLLEDWSEGRFDCFEHVIFTRGEDVSQRLYYYVCELQRLGKLGGPQPVIFDVARIARESSRDHTVGALRDLCGRLGIGAPALEHGIRRANALRAAFGRLRSERDGRGALYERIVRASLFFDLHELLMQWTPSAPGVGPRVALIGSAPPDDRIHTAIERSGGFVVEEVYDRNLTRLGLPVQGPGADPVTAIARRWLEHRFFVRDFVDPVRRVLDCIEAARADAAVLWFTREDEALAWHVPLLQRALQERHVPALTLSARAWSFEDDAAAKIESFLGARI